MGGSSSPEDIIDDFTEGFKKVGEEYLDITTDVALLGQRDEIVEGVTYGLKEITGANAAEEANRLAAEQIEQQRQAALDQRQEDQDARERDARTASRRAASVRSTSARRGGSRFGNLGFDEADFLGL